MLNAVSLSRLNFILDVVLCFEDDTIGGLHLALPVLTTVLTYLDLQGIEEPNSFFLSFKAWAVLSYNGNKFSKIVEQLGFGLDVNLLFGSLYSIIGVTYHRNDKVKHCNLDEQSANEPENKTKWCLNSIVVVSKHQVPHLSESSHSDSKILIIMLTFHIINFIFTSEVQCLENDCKYKVLTKQNEQEWDKIEENFN